MGSSWSLGLDLTPWIASRLLHQSASAEQFLCWWGQKKAWTVGKLAL